MKDIEQTYTNHAPVDKVWQALTDAKLIDTWGAGPSEFDSNEGGAFSLWGGDIHGTNTKVIVNQLLEEDWYGHDNPERCYKVRFEMSENATITTIKLHQKDVPDNEVDDFSEGWKDYYFDPIKQLLET